jgi:hypothetical protein
MHMISDSRLFPKLCQLWAGILIQTQPFFIAGLEDPEEAKTSAFGATGMFLFTFVASMCGIWYDSQHRKETVAEAGNGSEYRLSHDDVPTYGTAT